MLERLACQFEAEACGRKVKDVCKSSYVAIIKINFELFEKRNNNREKRDPRLVVIV